MTPLRALAREVVDLAWPVILAGLASTAVMFTDRLLLGRYSPDALGSMQVSGPLVWSLFSVFGAFSAGVMAVVGRAVGAGDAGRVRRTVAAALLLALAVGGAVGLGGWLSRGAIAAALTGGAASPVGALAVTYLGIVLPFSPLALVAQAGTVSLQAGGDTRTPLRIVAASGGVNLVVSYGLLFGAWGLPEWGIAGAATGTAAALTTHALLVLAALVRGSGDVQLARPGGDLLAPLRPVLRIAAPAFGEKVVFHAGYMAFVALVGRLGEAAMTAHQSLIAIESVGFLATSGFGVAAGALVAQKLGAGRAAEAERCGWLSVGIAVAALSGVSALFVLVPERLVGLFIQDPDTVALGAKCLLVAAVAQPLMAVTDALAGSLRGAGDTRTPMVVALAGPVAVRLAACWTLAFTLDLGLLGIWLGSTIDWGVRALWLTAIFARGRWKSIAV